MCGDNRDALWLSGEAEKLLVSGRFVLANGDEVLVFVTKEQGLAEVLLWMRFDHRDAIDNGSLKIKLHHHAQGSGEPRIHGYWEVQGADFAAFNEPGEGGERRSIAVIGISQAIVAFWWRAEGAFDLGLSSKRKKYRNFLDNGCRSFGSMRRE